MISSFAIIDVPKRHRVHINVSAWWLLVYLSSQSYAGIITMGDVMPDVSSNDNKTIQGDLSVGNTANGVVDITNGSTLSVGGSTFLGRTAGKAGSVTVNGDKSALTIAKSLSVGEKGIGSLTVENGGNLTVGGLSADIGASQGSSGTLRVSGGTVGLNVTGVLVGGAGAGTLDIRNGGKVTTSATVVDIGSLANSNGMVNVANKGSLLDAGNNFINVGMGSTGALTITDGGSVKAKEVDVFKQGTLSGKANVTGNVVEKEKGAKISGIPGTGTIDGNYTNASGTLEIESVGTGAAQFAELDITGSAGFSQTPTIDFDFMNFLPMKNDMFTFLVASQNLNISTSNFNCEQGVFICEAFGIAPGFEFEVESTPNSLIFKALNNAEPIPEPPTWLMLATGLACLLGSGWRQIRKITN